MMLNVNNKIHKLYYFVGVKYHVKNLCFIYILLQLNTLSLKTLKNRMYHYLFYMSTHKMLLQLLVSLRGVRLYTSFSYCQLLHATGSNVAVWIICSFSLLATYQDSNNRFCLLSCSVVPFLDASSTFSVPLMTKGLHSV